MTEPLYEVTMMVTVLRSETEPYGSEPQHHVEVTVRGHDVDKAIASALRSLAQFARRLASRTVSGA